MNFYTSLLNEIEFNTIIKKTVKIDYLDIPIPSDYKYSFIKINISNISSNTYINGIISDKTYIIPVNSNLGYRTIYNDLKDSILYMKKNDFRTVKITIYDQENVLMTFNEPWIIKLFIT